MGSLSQIWVHVAARYSAHYREGVQAPPYYTRGPPIRGKLFRLNRPDTEWIEKAIQENVKRGQLEKGSSDWGFPAFPTKEQPDYKAIHCGRRMVVDYRELNRVTVRKFFLIPNSDYI